jgi:hypothetical protein
VIDTKLIKRLFVWAGLAPAEEVAERQAVVNKVLVDPNNEAELARVAKMLDEAGVADEAQDDEEEEDDEEQVQIYSPKSRGHKRATKEEGIGAELAKMNEEARGTPFYADGLARQTTSAQSRELLEKLKKRGRR